jgi:hypothetical protein
MRRPLWELHKDLGSAVNGTRPGYHPDNFKTLPGGNARPMYPLKDVRMLEPFEQLPVNHTRPIYYLNKEVRRKRHLAWQRIVQEEEIAYARDHAR